MDEQEQTPIADREFEEQLTELLKSVSYLDGDEREQMSLEGAEAFADAEVRTFDEAGILTSNLGLVVRLADGAEFQITIVRSK
jgi:hypothetical protein